MASTSQHMQIFTPTSVVFRSPFEDVGDELPSPVSRRSTAGWGPQDEAARRFSEPVSVTHVQQLTARMTSARTAYSRAYLKIQQIVKRGDTRAVLEESTEKDLAEAAAQVLDEHATSSKGNLSRLVDFLHHYRGIFDVLSHADPSYMTIIWGGLKLMLLTANNRSDVLEVLTDQVIEVGFYLSRIEVFTKLFPTMRMIELTALVYAAVLQCIQQTIEHLQPSYIRQVWHSPISQIQETFRQTVDRVQRLERCIQQDTSLLRALQTSSMAHHKVDSMLQRYQYEDGLRSKPGNQVPEVLLRVKHTLFQGFHDQANYHEDLVATYNITASAWEPWFGDEQRSLPSAVSTKTRLSQGLCDAPDSQHALQWAAQQRSQSPHIPSAYLIWAKGLTAQAAIATLVFQILQQRPTALSEHNLDMSAFIRANGSIKALWDMFANLMRVLGGCLIYISVGSAGPDEFAIVEMFVKTVQSWDGPPISVTLIHPFHEGFVRVDNVVDLDGAYDVHPSLTTTDALYHILMLELNVHAAVSESIRTVLWESLWREVRYTAIGIALAEVTNKILSEAEISAREEASELGLTDDLVKLWMHGMQRWKDNSVVTNNVREQIQRHLDIVELELPSEIRKKLTQHLQLSVLRADTKNVGSRSLTQPERDRIWSQIQAAILPSAVSMFCGAVGDLVRDALECYAEVPCRTERHAVRAVMHTLEKIFGWEGRWKETFLDDKDLMTDGIVKGIMLGFDETLSALLQLEEDRGRPAQPTFTTATSGRSRLPSVAEVPPEMEPLPGQVAPVPDRPHALSEPAVPRRPRYSSVSSASSSSIERTRKHSMPTTRRVSAYSETSTSMVLVPRPTIEAPKFSNVPVWNLKAPRSGFGTCLSSAPKSSEDVSTMSFSYINMTADTHLMYRHKDEKVRVAVLDTGLDHGHEDFKQARTKQFRGDLGNLPDPVQGDPIQSDQIVATRDFCCHAEACDASEKASENSDMEQDDVEDLDGHGTQVAGIILRLAPHAELLIGRVCLGANASVESTENLEAFRRPQPEVVAKAIRWAIAKRVHVINLSLGFRNYTSEQLIEIRSALKEAQDNKIVVFAATSNEGSHEAVAWPASDQSYAIGIHSCKDGGGTKSDFTAAPSIHGANLMVVGENIMSQRLTSRGGGFSLCSGSSFATPVATAIGALLLAFVWQTVCKEQREEAMQTIVLDDLHTNPGMIKVLKAISTKPETGDYWSLKTQMFWANYRSFQDPVKDELEAREHAWRTIRDALEA